MALKVSWKKYDDLTDEELVGRFRASGDLEQLGVLYERYMHLVYGVCLKYFEDREEAKDGITAIFEKLIVELPKNEVEDFKSWLYVLTKNFCLMKIRAGKTEKLSSNKILMECIERLKDEQQQCIRLFYFEERSYKEIAAALKLEEKKVKSFIQNGKRNLKICIEGKEE
jgi:RNA polymerase sigma-70 factor (ECF subfamily)